MSKEPLASEPSKGRAQTSKDTVVVQKLSNLSKKIGVTASLQDNALMPLVWFFIVLNSALPLMILFMFMVEFIFLDPSAPRVIDSKVMMAVVGGITIQTGSIIVAAFKGLFR